MKRKPYPLRERAEYAVKYAGSPNFNGVYTYEEAVKIVMYAITRERTKWIRKAKS